MNTESIEILNAICEKIGVAIDWTGENVMPQLESLIEQYARYLLVSNIVWFSTGVLSLIGGIFLLRISYKSLKNHTWAYDECDDIFSITGFLIVFAGLSLVIFGFVFIIVNMADLIKCITIPQIYAAERLLSMIQQ